MKGGISCRTSEATNSVKHVEGFPSFSEVRVDKSKGTAAGAQQEGK